MYLFCNCIYFINKHCIFIKIIFKKQRAHIYRYIKLKLLINLILNYEMHFYTKKKQVRRVRCLSVLTPTLLSLRRPRASLQSLSRVLLKRRKNLFLTKFFIANISSCISSLLHFLLGVFCDITVSLFSRFPVDENRCDNF